MPHMDFYGKRADRLKVVDVGEVDSVMTPDGFIRHGRVKEVEEYTVTCPDCDGTGYNEPPGEVICEDCGMVLSDGQPVISTEYNADQRDGAGASMGSSRGLEKMDRAVSQRGTHEPSFK